MIALRNMVKAAVVTAAVFLGVAAVEAGADLVGKEAPEIKADGWFNSEKGVTLKTLRGKPVVVEFWATWCGPCRKTIPHLAELHKKYKDSGLVIVGLTDEPKDKVEEFTKKIEMPYVVGYGSNTSDDYNVKAIPQAFVVNAEGKIVWEGLPSRPEFDKAVEDLVAATKK
jgi:thiol-disulfide isomerase/thioredoxin